MHRVVIEKLIKFSTELHKKAIKTILEVLVLFDHGHPQFNSLFLNHCFELGSAVCSLDNEI